MAAGPLSKTEARKYGILGQQRLRHQNRKSENHRIKRQIRFLLPDLFFAALLPEGATHACDMSPYINSCDHENASVQVSYEGDSNLWNIVTKTQLLINRDVSGTKREKIHKISCQRCP